MRAFEIKLNPIDNIEYIRYDDTTMWIKILSHSRTKVKDLSTQGKKERQAYFMLYQRLSSYRKRQGLSPSKGNQSWIDVCLEYKWINEPKT